MTALAIQPISFSFHETHDVRIQVIDGEPWFCLKDVCGILSVTIASPSRFQMDMEGVTKNVIPTDGGQQQLTFVNEPNLYRVIFRSNKPEAKQFQDWVFNEVLPSIRKTGKYEQPQDAPEPLSSAEMNEISRLIWIMSHRFRASNSCSHAIWYALRQATRTPSPKPFNVRDMPIIADELRRIMSAAQGVHVLVGDFESAIIKKVIRKCGNPVPIMREFESEFALLSHEIDSGRQELNKYDDRCIKELQRPRLIN
ncbi:hypothetical protein SOASR030_02360 [Leminorella grimontii]|uniref:Bro-N domain-containing protein n=1 Tax=Leminorella grimontii TaxID=82981 RepID=A0AAV5MYY0_9GAMM|nr:BRO family protein [Leminorella grimontii]KFC95695.1 phage transcriptional regulator [Leminorella grimontii ATCC 33999 = DSM 5078]GKX54124.1 hypothetical protein SOASR030_02360 [Leminorella grimontii]VFS60002.1 Uncharacterized phage-encoded protein [Leminorella grimontii]